MIANVKRQPSLKIRLIAGQTLNSAPKDPSFMETAFVFLRYLARAAIGVVPGGGFAGEMISDLVAGIAKDAFDRWSGDRKRTQMRKDMEIVAEARLEEVESFIHQTVSTEAANWPEDSKRRLEGWLTQIPFSLQRSLRRTADPSGKTVPNHLVPNSAEEFQSMLPDRLPRFQSGHSPSGCGDWKLVRLLGAGGFGEVWMAENPFMPSAEPVALKFCIDSAAADQLRREAVLLDRVRREGRHPGIVPLLDTHLSAEVPCLRYEFVEGGDLAGLIREWRAKESGPSPDEAARIVLRIAEIMAFAHRLEPPIVHRDLKPANILIDPSSGKNRFRIADFGLGGVAADSASLNSQARSRPAEVLGQSLLGSHTPLYASPEQERGSASPIRATMSTRSA
ncbi:MAG: tRNA A-37 threonylcarbamoyl transferase component Bud32 [Verrucomicrobiales bacterium]